MAEDSQIIEKLYQGICILVDEKIKRLNYSYVKSGIVKSIDKNIAQVDIDGTQSNCKISSGLSLYIGDVVQVIIDHSDFSNKYIASKLMQPNQNFLPVTEDIADSVSKKHTSNIVDGTQFTISTTSPTSPPSNSLWYDLTNNELKRNTGTSTTPNWVISDANDCISISGKELSDLLTKAEMVGNTLPTASVSYRGMIFTKTNGTGVADQSYICIKDATDSYVWKQISLI